jgi:hypothetical protein
MPGDRTLARRGVPGVNPLIIKLPDKGGQVIAACDQAGDFQKAASGKQNKKPPCG